MLLWFVGASIAGVWLVFRSPALDYRLVALGSVVPVGEGLIGGARLAHTLVAAVSLLVLVMLATQKRRLLRRRLIGLPIGLLMHLVLDGIWMSGEVFWWPFLGWSFGDVAVPELDRPLVVTVVLEVAGAAALVWCYRTFGFDDPDRRRRFLRTGQLPRDLVSDDGA